PLDPPPRARAVARPGGRKPTTSHPVAWGRGGGVVPPPATTGRCLVVHHVSHLGGCGLAGWSGSGRVSDLGEFGPKLARDHLRLVVGDEYAPGSDVEGHLLYAGLAGQGPFDVGLAFVPGRVRRGGLKYGLAHRVG